MTQALVAIVAAACLLASFNVLASEGAAQQIYNLHCSSCHDGGGEAPNQQALKMLGQDRIRRALKIGVMKSIASNLSVKEIDMLANHLAPFEVEQSVTIEYCKQPLTLDGPPIWNRWGNGLRNTRFQSSAHSQITPSNVDQLKLKWAFAFPGATRARSQPIVTEEAIFVGSHSGLVYALDTETACVWWTFQAEAEVRSSLSLSVDKSGKPDSLYFGDFNANVYRLDAHTGKLQWKKEVDAHPVATITGSLTLYNDRLFVPVSSTEVISAFNPDYECCTFRGGLVALSRDSGEKIWHTHMVPKPIKQSRNSTGIQLWGPSGAPIWSVPTVDQKRGLVYVGTGENYSSPASDKSDAIVALNIDNGDIRWIQQTIANDAWNAACEGNKVNCPAEDGPDFDFGAPPILVKLDNGKDIILAGQKSGAIFGMDPNNKGEILWQRRIGRGGFNGGVHWGMTTDSSKLYVAIADTPGHRQTTGEANPGLHAFDIENGAPQWSKYEWPTCEDKNYRCYPALSAALSMTTGIVFAGGLDGTLHAYSTETGKPLWRYETDREFNAINSVKARGGSIDSDGVVIANGRLYINSGYDKFGEIPGNVLLSFEIEKD